MRIRNSCFRNYGHEFKIVKPSFLWQKYYCRSEIEEDIHRLAEGKKLAINAKNQKPKDFGPRNVGCSHHP